MQKRNGKYRIQYADSTGKIKSVTFNKKDDAIEFERKMRRERQLVRTGLELPKESQLVLDFAGKYLRRRFQNMKASTMDSEERNVKWFVEKHGLLPIRSVTTKVVRDFLDEIQIERNWSQASRNRCRAYLHIMFERAFQDEEIMLNPVSRIPMEEENPKRKIPLTPDEVTQFIDAAESPMRRLFAIVLVYQGPRVSEAVALQARDFDLKNNYLHLRRIWEQVSGEVHERLKGSSDGIVVPLLPIVRLAYEQYSAYYGRPQSNQSLFRREDGHAASVYTGKSWVSTLASNAGIKRTVSPHILRATFASLAEEKGMPREVIQKLMGHSSMAVTERYVTRRNEQIKSTVIDSGFGALEGVKMVEFRGAKNSKKFG